MPVMTIRSLPYLFSQLSLLLLFSLQAAQAANSKKLDKPSLSKELRIVILGDSLTAGYGIDKQEAFPALLEKSLQSTYGSEAKVINAGISGSTTASGLSRLKWQLKAKPTHLVLALGANDGLRGFKIDETRANLEKIIALAKENQIKVLLAGMKLPPNYGAEYTKEFEALFAELAAKEGLSFMPFLLQDVAGERLLNLSDGIHPNPEGHKVIAKNLWPFIRDFLE